MAASSRSSAAAATGHGAVGGASEDSWRWIEALRNPLAGVEGIRPHCMASCDLQGDGTSQVVAACPDAKLRVLDGRTGAVTKVMNILGEPSALAVFYPDSRAARVPALAVACGSSVFVYRNMRPFFKFALPQLPVHGEELELWRSALDGEESPEALYEGLTRLRDEEGASLSITSAELLALDRHPESNLRLYMEEHRSEARELKRMSVVTCMTAIRRSSSDERAQSQLVLGTEAGDVIVLTAAGTQIDAKFRMPGGAVPAAVHATGLWEVESRLVVQTRHGEIRTVRNKRLTSTVMRAGVPITDSTAMESAVVAAAMDGRLFCWSPKGKLLWTTEPPAPTVALCRVVDPYVSSEALAVALTNGEVRLYVGGSLIHSTGATDVDGSADPDSGSQTSAMVFGPFGRESRCLITAHSLGSVRVRVLPRRARLEAATAASSAPPVEQDEPMALPKRTRLHVQNVHRERADGAVMWRSFQRDRKRLHLSVLREYVKIVASGVGPDASDPSCAVAALFDPSGLPAQAGDSRRSAVAAAALRISAEVQGVGPGFSIVVTLTSALPMTASGARLLVECDPAQYELVGAASAGAGSRLQLLPAMAPRAPVVLAVPLRCVDPAGAPKARVRLSVLPPLDCDFEPGLLRNAVRASPAGEGSQSKPLVSLAVEMPQAAEAEF
ncbi:hypothetical protein FNF28_03461 [Cafeteria roenbergensis]|uniref:Bardet-Biedl syndrome 1 N-terminal domain-containing protein n=2 Tax=Cafeteria roenbergensis TaxID=33653 RepID=A0A5A8DJ15_CAFRO|nr:hypothetical protein FNF28_03461 [Cafeteria roenbergensis]|mmetsp:Transcript_19574/g.75071  ORF Transcript_19574/g.75071 Transcript_19574/m.75071 type:complete len:670 (-) Transcript_19574:62-2071(-)